MYEEELSALRRCDEIFKSDQQDTSGYRDILGLLNPIVIKSAEDENYRGLISQSPQIWEQLQSTLRECDPTTSLKDVTDETRYWYLRSIRGLVLLMRNLSVGNQEYPQRYLIQNTVINVFQSLTNTGADYSDMETALYIASTSFLHNVTKTSVIFDNSTMEPLMDYLIYPLNHPKRSHELLFPYFSFLYNLIQSDDFLYNLFRQEKAFDVLKCLLVTDLPQRWPNNTREGGEGHAAGNKDFRNLDQLDVTVLKCTRKIIANESFAKYFVDLRRSDTRLFLEILSLSQLVCTSSETWSTFELVGIMSWCFPIFEGSCEDIQRYFQSKIDSEEVANGLHREATAVLDMLTFLSQFEYVQKFILSYDGLEKLLSLFATLQENLIRVNFSKDNNNKAIKGAQLSTSNGESIKNTNNLSKRVDYENFKIKSTNFPECKLLIVETLSNLAFKNRAVQDKMRELHGLELVLSNCVIDDNDPFIKERCIICIRFLLDGNKENRDFVAKLEAKKVVDDGTLEEAGYEAKVTKEGKIELVHKQGGSSS